MSGAAADADREGQSAPRHKRWLTPAVASVGLTSFSSDFGHEITTSIGPTFVTVTPRSRAGTMGSSKGSATLWPGLPSW